MVCAESSGEGNGDEMANEREKQVVERARRKKAFRGLS
jgi:hypothetical protein